VNAPGHSSGRLFGRRGDFCRGLVVLGAWSALGVGGVVVADVAGAGGGTMGGSGAHSGAGGAGADAATAKRLAALRKKVLKDEDFVENDETNRDPFHSYLRLFVDHSTPKNRKIPAVFDKVGLEELTLIAIISGDETPRAMFRDATGFGQAVKKGDFLSRTGARVTKILSDRVIVEISETSGTGDTRVIEKAILVDPEGMP
jgi:Tfp pilus assembly protein PilP